ncbi:MAG: hypothetical protein U9R25_14800 [Chloroflexota bacterium]|nr:hypothetical protein [Chloroflexota bacterium]
MPPYARIFAMRALLLPMNRTVISDEIQPLPADILKLLDRTWAADRPEYR